MTSLDRSLSTGRCYRLNEPKVIADLLDDEPVIMNLERGSYYGLDPMASVIWQRLQSGEPIESIADAAASHYGQPHALVAADFDTFLTRLLDEDLLAESGAAHEAVGWIPAASFGAGSYMAPALVVYSDMTQLLALDPPLPA